MVKFVLMLQLCVSGMCYPPLTNDDFIFDTYKECTITGYEESLMYVGNMDDEYVNNQRPLIRFWCIEEKVKEKIST